MLFFIGRRTRCARLCNYRYKEKTISTTKASEENRSTTFSTVSKDDGVFDLQGIEGGRAFSFVIEEAGGHMTVSVARDGISVSVFGFCTDSDL